VFTALAKLYVRWRKVEQPGSYARSMVVRAAIDEVRRPWWKRESALSHAMPEQAAPDGTRAVDERLRVRAALEQLPVRQRAVLVLRFMEGLSVQEVAEALRCPEGTVKSHTSRGLNALRQILGPDEVRVTGAVGDTRGKGHREARYV
jgi:RNA polymerase sigma factor (sigma-70 family)